MEEGSAGTRWAMLALCFGVRIGLGFQFQTVGSVADPLAGALGLGFAEIGTLIGLFMVPGLVLSIPAGVAGRRFSDRSLIAAGLLTMALGGAVAALADGFALIAVGRLVCGAGFVVGTIFLTKAIADWFAGRELATAMAILVMSWPLGIAMGQVAHGWLARLFDWRVPFMVASLYCLIGAAAMLVAYRAPGLVEQGPVAKGPAKGATASPAPSLGRREWILTLVAALVWAAFNAGYIVYLSFAPQVLTAHGIGPIDAASTISLASWVMIFSGTLCGQIADRTGRSDLILAACLGCAMLSLALLPQVAWSIPLALLFGLLGMAPAGLIMALTGEAMAPAKRPVGMGIFFSAYFLLTAPAPAIAGWLYDRTGDPFLPILLAVAFFALTLAANVGFRWAQRRMPQAA